MTSRRDFLRYLLATPLAMTLDVEKLLWVPGQQIVVPDLVGLAYKGVPLVWDQASAMTSLYFLKGNEWIAIAEGLPKTGPHRGPQTSSQSR